MARSLPPFLNGTAIETITFCAASLLASDQIPFVLNLSKFIFLWVRRWYRGRWGTRPSGPTASSIMIGTVFEVMSFWIALTRHSGMKTIFLTKLMKSKCFQIFNMKILIFYTLQQKLIKLTFSANINIYICKIEESKLSRFGDMKFIFS